MKRVYSSYISHWLPAILCLWMAMAVSSCASEDPSALSDNAVAFHASISESRNVDTRAIEINPVTSGTYGNQTFYIYSHNDQTDNLSKYKVAAGVSGQLIADNEAEQLIWRNKTAQHTFSGWTMPWQTDDFTVGSDPQSKISFLQQDYIDMGFTNINDYLNCRILEKFIGAKTAPLSYQSNGQMVEMYYQHLVSKIHINPVKLVDNDGYTTNVTATMTFYQLPQSAIFDRLPEDGSAPKVIHDENAKLGISCSVGATTTLYVCPDMDFSTMQFSVHVEGAAGTKGDYYGDFRSVIFKRTETEQPEWDKDKSPTVLYAGEEMTIELTVREGNSSGNMSVNINPWSDRGFRNATGYPRKGIFSDSELLDMYNKFGSDYTQETFDEMFDIYGEEVDGQKVFYLYEDGQMSHTRLPVPKEAVLDGTGHTVRLSPVTHDINGKKDREVAHVGRCRNIFITDGTHIIYIDENFQIWTVDPDTLEMTKTQYVLPDINGTSYNSYYIDFETGEYQLSGSH